MRDKHIYIHGQPASQSVSQSVTAAPAMTSFRLYWLIAASGLAARSALAQGMQSDIARACSVYCYGDILAAVQQSGIYNDSKTFVDMPMRADPEAVNAAFEGIDSSDEAQLRLFLDTYFDPAGSDLDEWLPPDLQEQPAFLSYIQDPVLRAWGSELNQLWRALGREVAASVAENPQRHSFLPRRYPMIVPGGRFRESYYWDTWWIVRGLLVCDMTLTARYVIDNLLDDVENFGFIPNGGRIYYLDRSQPPLLSEMVDSYITALGVQSENATAMLERAFPLLQAEYSWWMDPSNGHVVLVDGHVFNRYHSNGTLPRPESYAEDLATAASAAPRESADVYASIRGGAESGWDFSSRWIAGAAPKRDLAHIHSADIVPVELNSIMYRWELNMARFAGLLGEASSIALFYQSAASDRSAAVEAVLWQEDRLSDRRDDGLWYDFNITAGTSQKAVEDTTLSLSQWVPMWAGE